MNYSELSTAIQDYLQDADTTFVTHIPDFVRQTEERIFRRVIIPDLRKTHTTALASGTATYAKPSDYLSTFDFAVVNGSGSYFFLLPKDAAFMREAYPDPTTSGFPLYYAESNTTNMLLAPTPDANYSVEWNYYYDPESIVTASTTWLGDNAESALLYGCLAEGYRYLKGDGDMMALYDGKFQEALQDLERLGMVMKRTDTYRE